MWNKFMDEEVKFFIFISLKKITCWTKKRKLSEIKNKTKKKTKNKQTRTVNISNKI